MKLSRFYKTVIKLGSQRDPRRKGRTHDYADTAILYGDPGTEINKIMVGIDIEVGELLLAEALRQREGLDLVCAHHPEGRAHASLYKVMQVQVDLLAQAGIRRDTAQRFMDERMQEVERRILAQNHTRPQDAARILDIPFMCMHTPADNHVWWFIRQLMDKARPKTVQDILEILKEVPEYRRDSCCGPRVILGNPKRKVGKIMIEMTGGTEGPRDIFDKLYQTGVRTLVSMHLSEEHFKKVKDANLNVVIAGHISSDTLGLNLLLDRLEKEAGEVFPTVSCSGFSRIRRK